MFSCTSLKNSSLPIRRVLDHRLCTQLLFTRSQGSTSSSSPLKSTSGLPSYGDDKRGDSVFNVVLSSGVLIVGSGLGFCYLNSSVSLADCPNNANWSTNDDQFEHEKKPRFLFGESYRRRVFFNYEKRIRLQSPPEKVFEYFASFRSPSGEVLMTPADLMRAVVPVFPPSESNRVREGFLRGERVPGELHCAPSKFFMLFDTNSDGLISFPDNGEIDREEFRKVMALMRDQYTQGARCKERRRTGFKTSESVENGGVLEYFFGRDGKSRLKHERFVQFLSDLHNEILHLEFSHYDYKMRGTIPAKDFALTLVASADISHINKLLHRVNEIKDEPDLRDIQITYEEFKNFAELRKKLQSFSLAIFSYGKSNGLLTRKDFQRAASQVCGISITNNVVDIIFHVFDTNRDGGLSSDEFVRVLQRRKIDALHTREAGYKGLLACWLSCASNCSST